MKKFLKIVVVLIIIGVFLSSYGTVSYNRGFKDGVKFQQKVITEICDSNNHYSTTAIES